MKITQKSTRVKKLLIFSLVIFFIFAPLVFGFWTQFVVSVPNIDLTLKSLEGSNVDFNVSFDSSLTNGTGRAPYHIYTYSHCNDFTEEQGCIERAPNLCPYLALEPKDGEDTEYGFTQNPYRFEAGGELNRNADTTDTWNLLVKSPCFEGECPADYDSYSNGEPLEQSLKGQTFKCVIDVQSSDFPDLVRNYLKQNIAFANSSLNTIEVSAVLTGEVAGCTIDCFSNVLFIPGLEASRLYKQKETIGVLAEDQLWEPNGNSDVEDLYLNTDGTSKNIGIYTRDIIKESNTPISTGSLGQNIYKSFADTMNGLVENFKITDWKSFAYDWRQGVDDIVNNGTKYQDGTVSLVDTLQSLVSSSKSKKVTIIAHSNGGLIAKALLKKLQDDKIAGSNNLIDSVDVLILVAVPEIGTASAVPAILHGYDQSMMGGWLIDEAHARELGRNMTSAFGLLPSKEYINHVSASPVTFVDTLIPSNITTKLVQVFGGAISSYTEYKDFLFGAEGRTNPTINQMNLPISLSQNLFSNAESLHDSIDNFIPPSNIRVIEVAGWGLDTITSFEYYPRLDSCGGNICASYILDERPRFTSDGDKTVVVPSAQYMSFQGNAEKYWVDLKRYNSERFLSGRLFNRNHADIFEVNPILDFISNTIQKLPLDNSGYITTITPIDTSTRLRLSIHSPVTLDAYDADGNHTGKICPPTSDFCYKEENITNSSYMEFGEGKYINLPEDQISKIKLQGTDVGTFTYDSEKVLPGGTSTISSFVDIPVTTQTQVDITLNQTTGTPQLVLDVTGDGTTDFTISPNLAFDPILFLQIMKKTVESFDISKKQKDTLTKRIDDTIKAIQKGKINKAKLKIEQFKKALTIHTKENDKDRQERERKNEKEHEKERKEHKKPKQLSSDEVQTLLTLLNQLLDNLN